MNIFKFPIVVLALAVFLFGCKINQAAVTPDQKKTISIASTTLQPEETQLIARASTAGHVETVPPTDFIIPTRAPTPILIETPQPAVIELNGQVTPDATTDIFQAITARQPLLVDGEKGWLAASGLLNGEPKTLILSAKDGSVLSSFEPAGQIALDRNHGRLIVDDGQTGLTMLDIGSGTILGRLTLPGQEVVPQPQVDPESGTIYAFRKDTIYLVNPALVVERTITLPVELSVCGNPGGKGNIVQSEYDLVTKRLFLTFLTFICTPWTSVTIVGYDASDMTPFGELNTSAEYQAVSFLGSLYGASSPRVGTNHYWAWNSFKPWFSASEDQNRSLRGVVADWERQMLYEAIGEDIRIIDAKTRQVVGHKQVDLLADGYLAGHDPVTDNLFFLVGTGRLVIWKASNLYNGADSPALVPSSLPVRPVAALAASPGWPEDQTLVGIWDDGCPKEGGQIFLRRGQGGDWEQAPLAEERRCDGSVSVVFSPDFAGDQILFAASNELETVLKSADGGHIWGAAGGGLPEGIQFKRLFISPAYSQDKTLFAHTMDGYVYKSQDDGRTWLILDIRVDLLAMSPEFGLDDRYLMGSKGVELFLSGDGGITWMWIGNTPDDQPLALLSLAPLFSKWQAVFALTSGGDFYRSLDAGKSWTLKMSTFAREPAQIVYAPDMEKNRPVFLLHGGELSSSFDGWDSTWSSTIEFPIPPAGISALAISPDFKNDGLLFVGTDDGQVIPANVTLPTLNN